MRRARLEGQHIGRRPLELDQAAIQQDRQRGLSLRQIAKGHRVSTATIQRVLRKQPAQAQIQPHSLDKTA
jgi:DNA invertase Pin-like site-specific DNA recombinase